MKFFIVLLTQIILFMQPVNAQQSILTNKGDYYSLIKKRNTNNTIGWVALGTGFTMIVYGGLQTLVDAAGLDASHRHSTRGEGIAVAGEIVALASIPFFIIAHSYKKKAHLALKHENVYINDRLRYDPGYTALVLKIGL